MTNVTFPRVLKELQDDRDVRVLVITGKGDSFCAGADVSILGEAVLTGRVQDVLEPNGQPIGGGFVNQLYNLGKPTIAAINGVAAGGGVSISLLCDIRLMSDRAYLSMSFTRRGLIPDCGCSYLMPRLIGTARTFEYLYTGAKINASEAERIGLVNRVVAHDKLMDEVYELASRIAKSPPLALAQMKKAIHYGVHNVLEQQVYFETYAQKFLFATEDFKEGLLAFHEKREPDFKGK